MWYFGSLCNLNYKFGAFGSKLVFNTNYNFLDNWNIFPTIFSSDPIFHVVYMSSKLKSEAWYDHTSFWHVFILSNSLSYILNLSIKVRPSSRAFPLEPIYLNPSHMAWYGMILSIFLMSVKVCYLSCLGIYLMILTRVAIWSRYRIHFTKWITMLEIIE